jgi:hypothetical protein
MEEDNAELLLSQNKKLFGGEPFYVYFMVFFIGVSCSAIFPDIANLLYIRTTSGVLRAVPHLIYLAGILVSRSVFLMLRRLFPVTLHLMISTLLIVQPF